MIEHEWVKEEVDGFYLGSFEIARCKNCGGIAIERMSFFGTKVKKIKIPSTNKYLTEDCEESLKIMQTYWEKASKKKSLYRRSKAR